MMVIRQKQRSVLFATLVAVALGALLGIALASEPSVDIGAVSLANGTLTDYLTARSVGGTTGICDQNDAPKPSYACFRRALQVSGLTDLLSGAQPVTVLAPTDAAFAHLESEVGRGAFNAFMTSPSATATFIRSSVVRGSTTLADLASSASVTSGATQLTTLAGTVLAVSFGDLGYAASRSTDVKIGSSDAVDGQSFVIHVPVRFSDGNVLIPLGRLTLLSLTA
ncbi:MAG: fasciclin domain-containing protein [Deinococcales bacterium]